MVSARDKQCRNTHWEAFLPGQFLQCESTLHREIKRLVTELDDGAASRGAPVHQSAPVGLSNIAEIRERIMGREGDSRGITQLDIQPFHSSTGQTGSPLQRTTTRWVGLPDY